MNKPSIASKTFDALMALALGIMATLVFINVVLRYIFNSGFAWSVELGQLLFVVMVFLGAINAFKDNSHLNVDILVKRLPHSARRIVNVIGNLLILYVLYLIFDGSFKLTLDNFILKTPALGIPLSFLYALGIILSIGMGVTVIKNIFNIIKKK